MSNFPLCFDSQFESKEQADAVLRFSSPHFAIAGLITAAIISIFEILLIIRVSLFSYGSPEKDLKYLLCYLFLLVYSLFTIALIFIWKKNINKNSRKIYGLQIAYTIGIAAWATAITLLDGHYHGYFDVVVFMNIMLINPIIVFVNPLTIIMIQMICDVIILTSILKAGIVGGAINFTIYSISSIFAVLAFQHTKKHLYLKQYELSIKAAQDPLTGILNRQTLPENGSALWKKSIPENTPVSVIMADIDFFKNINDKFGHLAGDKCIKLVANIFNQTCEGLDATCYRYGGEEFVMLIGNSSNKLAVQKAEEIMNLVKDTFTNDSSEIKLTLSLGIYTGIPSESETLERFLSKADKLLYNSKEAGRNTYTAESSI